jgi:hypothetical protein
MTKPFHLLVLLALALWACVKEVQATQVLVVVESDLGSDAASYEVRVTDARETAMGQTDVVSKPAPFSFAVVPAAKSPVSTNLIIVSALDASGNVIAVGKVLVTFRDRAAVQVTVRLTQACRGRLCDAGFSCDPSGGECVELQATQGKEVSSITPGSEFTMEGMSPGGDGGAGNGGTPGGEGTMSGTASGMAGGSEGMDGGAGGNLSGASPTGGTASAGGGMASGGTASGGTALGGTASGGATAGGAAADGGAMMGGTVDTGVDAGPPPECDATRTCSAGYSCVSGMCVSRCAQTTCDPNATCSLNASGAPVCTCGTGFLTMTGTGGAVTCMRLQACTDLRCDPTSTTCEAPAGQQPRCVCRPGYAGTSCAPVACPALTIANGSVDTGSGTFGATATYTCLTGYDKMGGTTRRCEANAMWSGTAPTCVAHNCGAPPAPTRGTVSTTGGTTFGATANYSCTSPFRLSPAGATRSCTASGWNGSTPACVGCGDGELQAGEQCDWANLVQDPWTCTTSCQSTGYYRACVEDVHCPAGLNCFVGACTSECAPGGVCPVLSSRAGPTSCQASFGCFVSCTRTQGCPPGTICRDSFCQGCNRNAASNECPTGQVCIGESEAFMLGRCQ